MFKILVKGKTIQELKGNLYIIWKAIDSGASIQTEAVDPEEQEDFLTEAAAQEEKGPSGYPIDLSTPAAPPIPVPTNDRLPLLDWGDADSKGLPWDARIHASSRTKNNDGSWRYRRGVEDNQIRTVEHELTAKIKTGAVQPAPAIAQAPVIPMPAAVAIPVVPPIPSAPIAPPMPSPPPTLPNAHTAETFKQHLVPTLAKLVAEGKLTQSYINQLKTYFGVDEIHKVSPVQAEEMFKMFVEYGMIAQAN